MKVLIIHRQKLFLDSIKEKFLLGGWQVHTTESGLDGLLAARHHPYDLMLCGFNLPVVSGTEIIRSSRNLSRNQNTPVIFLREGIESEGQIFLVRKLKADLLFESEIAAIGKIGFLISENMGI